MSLKRLKMTFETKRPRNVDCLPNERGDDEILELGGEVGSTYEAAYQAIAGTRIDILLGMAGVIL